MRLLGDGKNYGYAVSKLCNTIISSNPITRVNRLIKSFMIFGLNMDGKYLVFYKKFLSVLEKLFPTSLHI